MLAQGSFDFTAPAPAPGEVEILTAYLLNNPGFHTAKQLAEALAWSDRKIRSLAEDADGTIISGPGSPGYCHVQHCPVEKVNHITSKSISQAKKMIRKALKSRRIAHAIIR
jgi:hypothetical protein